MLATVIAAITAAFLLGAGLQRIAGLGMGLVAAPLLTLLLGPSVGVTLSNVGAVATTLMVLSALRGDVDWRAFARLAPLIVLGSIAGAAVIVRTSAAWLEVLIGTFILITLVLTLAAGGRLHLRGRAVAAVAGVAGGFMNATAGVAAPAMTVYAVATRWQQASFAATLQPILLLANLGALVSKGLLGAIPADIGLPWWIWAVVVGAVAAGVWLGGQLSRWVKPTLARRAAITIAGLGGVVTLVRGLFGVWG